MATDNLHEYSVSEISSVIKNLVESNFKHIKIRGEISGYKLAPSGHAYFSLKDKDSLINAICWRGTISKLTIKPEDGLEVLATGYVTTYPGQSKYQIIIEQMQHSGEGALMALLEEHKKKLAKEGLFDQSRKKPIPYLPETIGIITSPTGAVIQDIIHRIKDRFPTKILLWPVNVQGELAAGQITAAINGFNELHLHGITPPDVIIVARGGGSIEDLWPFNEEIVARATANSKIPIISAVGHETDTTLIDYVSDLRAPTPTAAAELAVPVRIELQAKVNNIGSNLDSKIIQSLQMKDNKLELCKSKFPNLMSDLIAKSQRLDDITTRLNLTLPRIFKTKQDKLVMFFLKLTHPKEQINRKSYELNKLSDRAKNSLGNIIQTKSHKINILQNKLNSNLKLIANQINIIKNTKTELKFKLDKAIIYYFDRKNSVIEFNKALLESYSFHNTLKRGYSIVKTMDNTVVKSKSSLTPNTKFIVKFADGECEIHS